jgi:hypothetical protein
VVGIRERKLICRCSTSHVQCTARAVVLGRIDAAVMDGMGWDGMGWEEFILPSYYSMLWRSKLVYLR